MKPAITFHHKKDMRYKRGIALVVIALLIGGIISVILVSYNIILLHQCEKLVGMKGIKQHSHGEKESVATIKKNVLEYVSIKQKYEQLLKHSYQLFHWYFFIHDTVKPFATIEQLSISKHTISCSLTSPEIRDIQHSSAALSKYTDFEKINVQSCSTKEPDRTATCLLKITIKKKKSKNEEGNFPQK